MDSSEEATDHNRSHSEWDENEEDTAHSLILLSRGGIDGGAAETEPPAIAAAGKTGRLGGRCTSHNKLKPKPPAGGPVENVDKVDSGASISKPEVGGGSGAKVHVCPVCLAEFVSGQALGGHMGRHRPWAAKTRKEKIVLHLDLSLLALAEQGYKDMPPPPAVGPVQEENKADSGASISKPETRKEKGVLDLDLNLPAPAEEGNDDLPPPPAASGFPFFFLAMALVDCHY